METGRGAILGKVGCFRVGWGYFFFFLFRFGVLAMRVRRGRANIG